MNSMGMAAEETKRFVVRNRMEELPLLAEKVEALAAHWKFAGPMVMNLNLVLEEALSNIIFYAFRDQEVHKIRISITREGDRLTIRIRDDGVPFDPTAAPAPDTSLPAGERPIGGLGILLISKLMDNVHYARIDNQNILTLTKFTGYEHNT
jgi:anti-sigma regulatory factor (Ser/Thr protein kinase)